jgi:hypothetical protein
VSDLKHKTVEELRAAKVDCETYISELQSKLNGARQRHEWIERYLFEKTPKELSMAEIEARLGHRVILVVKP